MINPIWIWLLTFETMLAVACIFFLIFNVDKGFRIKDTDETRNKWWQNII